MNHYRWPQKNVKMTNYGSICYYNDHDCFDNPYCLHYPQ